MQTKYVPILRWKQGERVALSNLSNAGRIDVTPHLVLLQGQYGDTKVPKQPKAPPKNPPKIPPATASGVFAKQVAEAWGPTKLYLDAADLPGTATAHHLDNILASANAAGLHIVPSIKTTNAPPSYQAAVARAVHAHKQGAALRISLSDLTTMPTWIGSWFCPIQETDLIIDLANGVANVLALGAPASQAFANLHQATSWRSVTVAGGNIPAMLSGYTIGQTPLPRAELNLWTALTSAGVGYDLDFGDYATIGPDASTEEIPGPVPINAKYTLHSMFAVFHGVKTKGPGSMDRGLQYRNYAGQIAAMPNRGALAHCWGDAMIDLVNSGPPASPGSPTSWVSFSINRHIELTRSQLP
ncbi:MAG: hypothetical protein EOS71_27180 [Mesorhizobium sp.]|nr:hypothetical protein EOA35_11570 [Mesorhizobium sp. M8A.F.Ca.ET.023.01.1.1]RWC69750.1 MAG: hypothetical protein EOS71_27180 [Mesorhizobium sp.]